MIANVDFVKNCLRENGLKPNRALGQNFFIDGDLLRSLCGRFVPRRRPVLEVGAGLGALTEPLLELAQSVTAIEKDATLAELLERNLPNERLTVIRGDALKCDLGFMDETWYACGNLPYYITTPISERLICRLPERMMLMVQREAAERFTAAPGQKNYCPLTIASELYYDITPLAELSPASYYPEPEVHSAVLLLVRKRELPSAAPDKLLSFASECLAMRRKTLYNNIKDRGSAKALIMGLGLNPDIRAERLTPSQFLSLYLSLKNTPDGSK